MEASPSALSTQVTDDSKNLSKIDESLTQAGENLTQADENLTQTDENLIQADENLTQADENLTQAEENLTQADEIVSLSKESASLFNVEESIIKQQTSEVDLNTILGFESEEYSESKHESEVVCPLGEDYIPLTPKIIEEKKRLLGAIRLYWPVSPDISLKSFPESYKLNSNKEKVLLLYAENFRKQYHANFPTKKPLLLAIS